MGKTYTNTVEEKDVGLAIENILVAPYGTSWTPAKVDISSPPAGFTHLGAVKEDTPNLTVTRSKFQLKTGIPQSLQYEAIMGLDGKFSIVLYSRSSRKLQYALANVAPINLGVANATSVSSVTSRTVVTVSSAAGLAVDQFVVTATSSAALESGQNEAAINSINGTDIYLYEPGFGTLPGGSDAFASFTGTRIPYGTAQLRKFTVLGVADFTDGVQVVHYMPKASGGGEMVEELQAGDVAKIPMQFDLYTTTTTLYGGSELIVGERFWFS
jgi:hypothetical protein